MPRLALAAVLLWLAAGCEPAKDDRPLTDFACAVEPAARPRGMKAGAAPLRIKFRVTNTGQQPWPGWRGDGSRIKTVGIGARWLPGLKPAGLQTALFEDLAPGESVDVELDIAPPAEPGEYTLRVEPVQEQVSWFGDQGGDCMAKMPVSVTP